MAKKRNIIVGQSGGPTAVINSSLAGVYKNAIERGFDKVYGMLHGIQGLLDEQYIDLSTQIHSELDIELLKRTPSAFLGSCRYKLPEIHEDKAIYEKIFEILNRLDIDAFIYIGGNDSMDTIKKLSDYAILTGQTQKFLGVPKTIDNDLALTDHTPGFGSAAKYVASTVREIAIDASVYDNKKSVTIVEIMGRHAGWLTAASVLARKFENDNPVLIYLPESAFNTDTFIEDVKKALEHTSNLVVCVSEGINDGNGTFICELASDVGVDTFGHKMLTGSGKYLENLVKEKLGVKVRSIELNVNQRCSSSMISATDQEEAIQAGISGVHFALDGITGKMIAFHRTEGADYSINYVPEDVNLICNQEKTVPPEWITGNGSDIGQAFIDYALPLIQGIVNVPEENGLPKFAYRK